MARKPKDAAQKLISIYTTLRKRFILTGEDLLKVTGHKKAPAPSFFDKVEEALRAEGYTMIHICDEAGSVALLEVSGLKRLAKVPKELLAD